MRGQPLFAESGTLGTLPSGKITMPIRWPLGACFAIFNPAPSHQCASPKITTSVFPTRATSAFKQGVLYVEGFLLVSLNPSTNHHTEQGIAELMYLSWHGLLAPRLSSTSCFRLRLCHLKLNSALTTSCTQFINLLMKGVEVFYSFTKMTASLTA